jgi:uncharacterized protein (TIGR02145 family)
MKNLSKLFTLVIIVSLVASCSKDDDNRNSNNGGGGSTSTGCSGGPSTVTDIDGNVYNVVSIGNQCWMKENLRTTRYNNGNPIHTNLSLSQMQNDTIGYWSFTNNNAQNINPYGHLYNWYAVADYGGLCPTGWHVPSLSDWYKLAIHIDPQADTSGSGFQFSEAGGALKTTGDLLGNAGFGLWQYPNIGATNSSGFSAVPSGFLGDSIFSAFGYYGFSRVALFWSSTEASIDFARGFSLEYDREYTNSGYSYKNQGRSIRCIRD